MISYLKKRFGHKDLIPFTCAFVVVVLAVLVAVSNTVEWSVADAVPSDANNLVPETATKVVPDYKQKKFSYRVGRMRLEDALSALRKQTDQLEVGFALANAKDPDVLVGPIVGEYTVDEALAILIHELPLIIEWSGNIAWVLATSHADLLEPQESR